MPDRYDRTAAIGAWLAEQFPNEGRSLDVSNRFEEDVWVVRVLSGEANLAWLELTAEALDHATPAELIEQLTAAGVVDRFRQEPGVRLRREDRGRIEEVARL